MRVQDALESAGKGDLQRPDPVLNTASIGYGKLLPGILR